MDPGIDDTLRIPHHRLSQLKLGGGTVVLVWVRSDARTLRNRLTARGLGRDSAKLANFDAFTASMRLGTVPAAPHLVIDNRLDVDRPLAEQIRVLLAGLGLT